METKKAPNFKEEMVGMTSTAAIKEEKSWEVAKVAPGPGFSENWKIKKKATGRCRIKKICHGGWGAVACADLNNTEKL